MLDCIVRIVQEEGLLSLWGGNGSSVLRYYPSVALSFSLKLGQGKAIEDPHADCYKDGEDQSDMVKIHEDQKFEEEIKITSLTVFINLYSEPDEEEGEKAKEEENAEDEDKVRFWTLLNISCL
ncbi:uncharacterized protein LOC116105567 isoform X7 [Pistacia vera]|uniref:uncharacterized protein LOC116105567 isoform X7 n=1 Tax=Pistacia vera TaxID=55513 RepID=UPI0012631222|nr:uncharacterized protein LOC116105567 isoform X7 [Pistacia vera]